MRTQIYLVVAFSLMFVGLFTFVWERIPDNLSDPECILTSVEQRFDYQFRWEVNLKNSPPIEGETVRVPYYWQHRTCKDGMRSIAPLPLPIISGVESEELIKAARLVERRK